MGPFVCCAGNNVCLQDDKLTILATLFWVGTSLLESDYEHEFLLGVRLLARVMARLPLDRPDVRERLDRTQAHTAPSLHSLLLKATNFTQLYNRIQHIVYAFNYCYLPVLTKHCFTILFYF